MTRIRIPTTRPRLVSMQVHWLVVAALVLVAFKAGLYAAGQPDSTSVGADQLDDAQLSREHDLELISQVGAVAREAHAQGMREAIAAMRGTPDGDVLQRTCTRLWGMDHTQ